MRRIILVAGVDEAGRGPLAGPVVAAAVILDPKRVVRGLADSKVLSPERREELAILIRERAIAWATGQAEVAEIDTINILHATMLAMCRAVAALSVSPEEALVDGDRCPDLACRVRAIVKGDRDVKSISAASIIAKTTRDAMLRESTSCIRSTALPSTRAMARRGISPPSSGTGRVRSTGARSRRCTRASWNSRGGG